MRSVSQIYSEAVTIRNNYLQLTELNTGRSNVRLSMLNLLTYVVAVCIHTYEAILDVFQVRMAEALHGRINGTPDWYAAISRKFQYNPITETGDELVFNEDTLKVEYKEANLSNRIIEKAAWQMNPDSGTLVLKVCKANSDSNELNAGIPYEPLSDKEMTAFRMFIQQIKFVGAEVESESLPGDIVTIIADERNPIFYNDSYVTKAQAMENIRNAFIQFSNEIQFNGMLYYQSVIDVIRKTENITEVGNSIKVMVSQYEKENGKYGEQKEISTRVRLKSGYIRFMDTDTVMTINEKNLTLIPASQMDGYLQSIKG